MIKNTSGLAILILFWIPCLTAAAEFDETWLYPEYQITHISPTHIGIGSSDGLGLKTGKLLFISRQPFGSFNEIKPSVYTSIFNNKQFEINYKQTNERSMDSFLTRDGQTITVNSISYKSYAEVVADYDEKHGYPRCDRKISELQYSMPHTGVVLPKNNKPCRSVQERTEDEIDEIREMLPKTRDVKITLDAKTITLKDRLSFNSPGGETSLIGDIEYVDGKIWVLSFYSGDHGAFLESIRTYDLEKGNLLKEMESFSGWPARIVADPYRPIVWVATRGSVYSINRNTYRIVRYNTSFLLDNQTDRSKIVLAKNKGVIDPFAVISYEIDKSIRKEFIKAAKTIEPDVKKIFDLYSFYMGMEQRKFPRELNILKPFFIKMDKITQEKNKNIPYSYNSWPIVLSSYDEKQQLIMSQQRLFVEKFIRFGLEPPLGELTSSSNASDVIIKRFGQPKKIDKIYKEVKHRPGKYLDHLTYTYNGMIVKLFATKETGETWLDRIELKNSQHHLLGNLRIGDHYDRFKDKMGRGNYDDGTYIEYKVENRSDVYTGILYVGVHFEKRISTEVIWSTSPIFE